MSTTAQPGDQSRVFPPIGGDMYRVPHAAHAPTQTATWALLRLADESLSFTARYFDRNITPPQQVGRALSLHRDALAAELVGRCERADFFWRQLFAEVSRFDTQAWATAGDAAALSPSTSNEPDAVRKTLVRELFIETHLAFYRGYIAGTETLTLASRAFVHFRYATRWLDRADLSERELLPLLAAPSEMVVALCTDAKDWSPAVDACELVLKHCPGSLRFQDRLSRLHWDRAMAGITTESGSAAPGSAKQLLAGIQNIEGLIKRYPYCSAAYDYAAHLYHIRAIRLANSGVISQALRDCEQALAYDSSFAEAHQTKALLIDLMKKLQEQVKEVLADLATRPNAHLNDKGKELRDEADAGFAPAIDYYNSAERTQTLQRAFRARARRVWNRIGLPEPSDDFDGQAQLLYEAIGRVIARAPADRAAIVGEFASVVAHPHLSAPQWDAVVTFVEQQLGFIDAPAIVDQSPELPAGQALAPTTTAVTRGGEPLAYWALSGQDRRVKVQAIAAVALVLLGTGLIGRETFARQSRDAAYAQLEAASRDQQYLKVIDSAEQFLTHLPLSGTDARREEVITVYGEALVRWVAAQLGQISADGLVHADRYRQLTSAPE